MNKKEILKKVEAAIVAATMGITLSGCDFTGKINDKDVKVTVDDETIDEIIDGVLKITTTEERKERETTTQETTTTTTQTTTETTYTQPLTTSTTMETTMTNPVVTSGTTIETTTETTAETTKKERIESERKIYSLGTNENYSIIRTYKSEGEYIYSIAKKFVKSNIAAFMNEIKTVNELGEEENYIPAGKELVLPITAIYYNAAKGDNLISVYLETGITCDKLCTLNEIDAADSSKSFDEDKKILLTVLENGKDRFMTDKGTAIIFHDNLIYADELYIPIGYAGASQNALALHEFPNESNFVEAVNYDGYKEFNGQLIAENVQGIEYNDDDTPVIIANDDTILYRTSFSNFYKIHFKSKKIGGK